MIVSAELPRRRIRVDTGRKDRVLVRGFEAGSSSTRLVVLRELSSDLASVTGHEPTVLRSASALALTPTGQQVREFVDHPLIRSIQPNRRLVRKGEIAPSFRNKA